jgi:hypothetical protein
MTNWRDKERGWLENPPVNWPRAPGKLAILGKARCEKPSRVRSDAPGFYTLNSVGCMVCSASASRSIEKPFLRSKLVEFT